MNNNNLSLRATHLPPTLLALAHPTSRNDPLRAAWVREFRWYVRGGGNRGRVYPIAIC
jgi:hypothetical protein